MFNKKGLKCFGLLSLLSIMLGLSLNVSSDVSALRHDIRYIPIYSDSLLPGTETDTYQGVSMSWTETNNPSRSDFKLNQLHYFTSRISNNRCTFENFTDKYKTTPTLTGDYGYSFTYLLPSYRYIYGSNPNSNYYSVAPCMQTVPFGTLYSSQSNIFEHPNFDDSSLVNIPPADRPPFLGLTPYYYDFDSFYVDDSAVDTNTGMHYNNTLKMSSILGFKPVTKFNFLLLGLGRLNEDVVGQVTEGRSIELKGVFDFSGEGNYFNWHQSASTSSSFRLHYLGYNQSRDYFEDYVNCSTNFVSLEFNHFYQLEFSCSFSSPADFYNGQLWFSLELNAGYGVDYLFDTNADWSFTSSYFITDNDETPGGTWGTPPTGNHLSSAPGSAEALIPSGDDFFSSLTNLFTFGFFNPFAPIFQMFSDNNSCASIPTISGMIHSEETEVCPWFDSSIRNIVTPVLGLSSMMLVFGFAVRWLGSSSGNLFEDSQHEEVSNQGGRWGHYRKGGN